jgi:hypothetical protein
MDDYSKEQVEAKWNFDAAELLFIFDIKTECARYITEWKLDECYWRLRDFRRELDAKLVRGKTKIKEEQEKESGNNKEVEKEVIDNSLNSLTGIRESWNKNQGDIKEKLAFYNALEEFYMELCHVMKKHGLYFREGEQFISAMHRR